MSHEMLLLLKAYKNVRAVLSVCALVVFKISDAFHIFHELTNSEFFFQEPSSKTLMW
jgi:hypothetical protein